MTITRMWTMWMLGAVLCSYGCATYVNIPPLAGDVAAHNANDSNVLAVEAEAIKAAVEDWQLQETFMVKTLPDTRPVNYFAMVSHISEHATVDEVQGATRIEVRQLYIRGSTAKVDLVRTPGSAGVEAASAAAGEDELVTVHLQWKPFVGWQSTGIRQWQVDVTRALPPSALQADATAAP